MARIRSMKPELRTSLVVASWPREVRYFWTLLWGYLDDHGRGVDNSRLVKADCMPLDDDVTSQTIDEWLGLIAKSGPLCRYEVDGRQFIHAVNWTEHQKPQHPKDSQTPLCPLHENVMKPSGDHQEDLTPEQVVRAGEQGAGEQGAQRAAAVEKFSGEAARIVGNATGATPAEADSIVDLIRKRKPKSLVPFVKRLAGDGDLAVMLADLRRPDEHARVADLIAAARDGPPCIHGDPGGATPHPVSGEPLCPSCRRIPSWASTPTALIRAVAQVPRPDPPDPA